LPYYRLRRAYLDLPTRSDRKPLNYCLSAEQDLALERYLDAIDTIGYGIYRGIITSQAYALLKELYTGINKAPKLLGKNWARRWLARHLKYARVKAKLMEIQQKLAQELEALRSWFNHLESFINKHRIQPRDTYNMDETSCQIGVTSNQYVYTQRGQQVFIPNANNHELVTLVECISTNGASITPIVIVKAQSVMEHWISDLLDNYLISVSDSGYTNNSLTLNWLKHFEKITRRRQVGTWQLLLINGHRSYNTKQFAEFTEKHKIQLFTLPPHTTYILQPLNVGCFQPLKWYYGSCLD
ncbi:DDE-domain-containing protein, partial [Amniculicola lignicola CBS 123094]